MILLYNLLLRIYFVLVLVASVSNSKAKKWIVGRCRLISRMRREIQPGTGIVWFHCASLGEFEQGRPIIEAYKLQHPEDKILLTFFSPSGYEVRKNYAGADYIYYLPLDTYFNAKRFVEIVQPKMAIFVKYEFWYHYLQALRKNSVPTYVVSAIFRPNQIFFKWYGGMFRKMLTSYRELFVQNQQSSDLLKAIGVTNVTVSGDTRFDRVADIAQNAKSLPIVEAFVGSSTAIVAGSTWPEDETIIANYISSHPHQKIVIAPHEIGESHIDDILSKFRDTSVVRYTKVAADEVSDAQVLLIDTIGILSSVYSYGKIAYIGGGFGVGIHNTLEAATFGMPVVFGPNYHKFQEAKDLIDLGASKSISNAEELSSVFDLFLEDRELLDRSSVAAKCYVHSKIGATKRILDGMTQK